MRYGQPQGNEPLMLTAFWAASRFLFNELLLRHEFEFNKNAARQEGEISAPGLTSDLERLFHVIG